MAPVNPVPPVVPAVGPSLAQRLLDIGERTFWTFVQTALGLLVVSGIGNVKGFQLAAAAGVAAAFTVLKNAFTSLAGSSNSGNLVADMVLRTFFTYVAGFLGLVMTNGAVDFSNAKMALYAAAPAALAIIKGFLAQYVGNPNTAGTLPSTVAVPVPTDLALAA